METLVNFEFGEIKCFYNDFGDDIGINGFYSLDNYGDKLVVTYSYSEQRYEIEYKQTFLLKTKISLNGEYIGKIIGNPLRWRNANWKYAFIYNGSEYSLVIDSGPEHDIGFNIKGMKKAFSKEFKYIINKDGLEIGSVSGPAWRTGEVVLKMDVPVNENLFPFLAITFFKLSQDVHPSD